MVVFRYQFWQSLFETVKKIVLCIEVFKGPVFNRYDGVALTVIPHPPWTNQRQPLDQSYGETWTNQRQTCGPTRGRQMDQSKIDISVNQGNTRVLHT
jgi:hypothetical protein